MDEQVRGSGVVADAVRAALIGSHRSGRVVVATDTPDRAARAAARSTGAPLLPVHTEPDAVVIGPLERPGSAGCADCADRRWWLADDDPDAHAAMHRRSSAVTASTSPLLTPLAAELVAALVVEETARPERTVGAQITIDLRTLRVASWPILPCTDCPVCAHRSPPTATGSPPHADDGPAAIRRTSIRVESGQIVTTVRSHSGDGSKVITSTGYGDTVTDSATDATLAHLRVWPSTRHEPGTGHRAEVQAQEHGTPGIQNAADAQEWAGLTAWSYRDDAPVPTSPMQVARGLTAVGRTAGEALRRGLLEILAVDAALLTWYPSRPAPVIELQHDRTDVAVAMLAAAIEDDLGGHRVRAYDTTPEHGVPCVFVVAARADDHDPGPVAACAAAANPERDVALHRALHTLRVTAGELHRRFPADLAHATRLAADPALVASPDDHPLRCAAPGQAARWRFLLNSITAAQYPAPTRPESVLEAVLDSGLDVLSIDDTTTEHSASGFVRLRVLVPDAVHLSHDVTREPLPRRLTSLLPAGHLMDPHPLHPWLGPPSDWLGPRTSHR